MTTKILFVSIVLLALSTVLCNARYEISTNKPKTFCINENDDSWINRCHRQIPSNLFTLYSNAIIQWINPRLQAVFVVFIILLVPICVAFSPRASSLKGSLKFFYSQHLIWVNFLHRMSYSLILDVALYTVFRQSRPCKCTSDGGLSFSHYGSIYGMPSGDAMAAGLLGALVFDYAPYNYLVSKVVGALILPVIAVERITLGYHTFAQTCVGGCLGFALHYYSTRAPQFMMFFDAIIQIFVGTLILHFDPALTTYPDDMNNLLSWLFWGIGFELMALILVARFYLRPGFFTKILFSLNDLTENGRLFDDEKSNKVLDKMVAGFVEKKKQEAIQEAKQEAKNNSINSSKKNYEEVDGEVENDEESAVQNAVVSEKDIKFNRWGDLIYFGDYWVLFGSIAVNAVGALISQALSQYGVTKFW